MKSRYGPALYGILLAVVAVGGAILATGSQSAKSSAERHRVYLHATDKYHFENLCDMAEASDVVAQATVISTQAGRLIGSSDDPHSQLRMREVELSVKNVLYGSAPSSTITFSEIGWDSEGNPVTVNNEAPSAVGETGVYFLILTTDPAVPGWYEVISSQGRYAVSGESLIPASGLGSVTALGQLVTQIVWEGLPGLVLGLEQCPVN
jgi:hypothetical protein